MKLVQVPDTCDTLRDSGLQGCLEPAVFPVLVFFVYFSASDKKNQKFTFEHSMRRQRFPVSSLAGGTKSSEIRSSEFPEPKILRKSSEASVTATTRSSASSRRGRPTRLCSSESSSFWLKSSFFLHFHSLSLTERQQIKQLQSKRQRPKSQEPNQCGTFSL